MFFCLLCHGPCPTTALVCAPCHAELPWLQQSCRTCAEPLSQPAESLCPRCQQRLSPVDHCAVPLQYRFPVDQLILALKSQRPELLKSLGQWLCTHLRDSATDIPDLLLPVPMHSSKQRQRGFNQAGLLAYALGRSLNIPVHDKLLSKSKSTESQKTLSREQRQQNLAGAFKLDRVQLLRLRPRPRHIALVDDVITTGATTAQLAALLKQAGIARVDVWALAKTPLHHSGNRLVLG